MVKVCINRSIQMGNVEPVAYEDEWSFSLLDSCTPVNNMSTSSRFEVNSIDWEEVKIGHLLKEVKNEHFKA